MTKLKVTISLDSEIAEKLRLQSIEKYHNSRSMSRLIEDLANGAVEAKKPEACSILGHRSEYSFRAETEFMELVKQIKSALPSPSAIDRMLPDTTILPTDSYFALKEAVELHINWYADIINECWRCAGLNGPVPKYPDAGKNFEIYATMKNDLR